MPSISEYVRYNGFLIEIVLSCCWCWFFCRFVCEWRTNKMLKFVNKKYPLETNKIIWIWIIICYFLYFNLSFLCTQSYALWSWYIFFLVAIAFSSVSHQFVCTIPLFFGVEKRWIVLILQFHPSLHFVKVFSACFFLLQFHSLRMLCIHYFLDSMICSWHKIIIYSSCCRLLRIVLYRHTLKAMFFNVRVRSINMRHNKRRLCS